MISRLIINTDIIKRLLWNEKSLNEVQLQVCVYLSPPGVTLSLFHELLPPCLFHVLVCYLTAGLSIKPSKSLPVLNLSIPARRQHRSGIKDLSTFSWLHDELLICYLKLNRWNWSQETQTELTLLRFTDQVDFYCSFQSCCLTWTQYSDISHVHH